MTENDYIAMYVKEKRPEIITSFDFFCWKMCRIMTNALDPFVKAFSCERDIEEGDD